VTEPRGELARSVVTRAAEAPDQPCLLTPDGAAVSYGALLRAARQCADELRRVGLRPGQRVALVLDSQPGFPAWYAGAQLAGLVPCPVTPHQTEQELGRSIAAVDPACALADREGPAPVPTLLAPPWDVEAPGPPALQGDARPLPAADQPPQWQDIAAVHITMRGSGGPLGVMHTAAAQRAAAASFCQGTGLRAGEVVLGMLPFAHIFSFTANLLAPLHAGATLLLAHGVNARDLPALIQARRPALAFLTPAQAERMADVQEAAFADLSSLERVWCGGAAFDDALVQRFGASTGLRLLQGYGLTEAFVVCANPYRDAPARPETIGLPFPGYQMRVVGSDGQELADGEAGALQVAGPAVMAGFLGQEDLTAEVMSGPWLRTGDRAARDADGHFRFCGWDKPVIKTLGLVVDLQEVEAQLRQVVPRAVEVELTPHLRPRWGHVLDAKLTVRGPLPDEAEVRQRLGRRLSFYKIPRRLELVPADSAGER